MAGQGHIDCKLVTLGGNFGRTPKRFLGPLQAGWAGGPRKRDHGQ